ncbi:hypothetical protein [Haloechinothrix halophila]|uniref:hypothetical protein n=1 Tax=Haloechinothrix halophila TaxID=1069073 RepID=UPI000553FBA2|nr:hypothetical protein [Haloechinothrix halophila]
MLNNGAQSPLAQPRPTGAELLFTEARRAGWDGDRLTETTALRPAQRLLAGLDDRLAERITEPARQMGCARSGQSGGGAAHSASPLRRCPAGKAPAGQHHVGEAGECTRHPVGARQRPCTATGPTKPVHRAAAGETE